MGREGDWKLVARREMQAVMGSWGREVDLEVRVDCEPREPEESATEDVLKVFSLRSGFSFVVL